jgi:hypothetical protein
MPSPIIVIARNTYIEGNAASFVSCSKTCVEREWKSHQKKPVTPK